MRRPTKRERNVLQEFVTGTPEPWGRFAGAGQKTLQSLLLEGWIRPNQNPDFPSDYFEITEDGAEAAYR